MVGAVVRTGGGSDVGGAAAPLTCGSAATPSSDGVNSVRVRGRGRAAVVDSRRLLASAMVCGLLRAGLRKGGAASPCRTGDTEMSPDGFLRSNCRRQVIQNGTAVERHDHRTHFGAVSYFGRARLLPSRERRLGRSLA